MPIEEKNSRNGVVLMEFSSMKAAHCFCQGATPFNGDHVADQVSEGLFPVGYIAHVLLFVFFCGFFFSISACTLVGFRWWGSQTRAVS